MVPWSFPSRVPYLVSCRKTWYLINFCFFFRLESKFKKGYPHGVGKVTDDEGSLIWDGIIWNGKPMGNVSEDIENLFLDLNLNPLRLKYQET